ncbi:MAG: 50S ribosome-binding GTPase, partial [Alphaproteobacteria bacterium]|nr:50S ribosome-binding GTPase [Alphaproteobacteria bacterium]
NAGKSTLFNKLTQADVFAKDMLFATLDPTMRQIKLPSGQIAILSDTVGFVSDLPTELVMAFRATLEEVLEADVIVHVRDYFHPDTKAQKKDVEAVLSDLGLKEKVDCELIEALNKIDMFEPDDRQMICNQKKWKDKEWPISAITGEGVKELLFCIEETLNKDRQIYKLMIPIEDGKTLARLYQKGQIVKRTDNEKTITLFVKLKPEDVSLFQEFITKKGKKNG